MVKSNKFVFHPRQSVAGSTVPFLKNPSPTLRAAVLKLHFVGGVAVY